MPLLYMGVAPLVSHLYNYLDYLSKRNDVPYPNNKTGGPLESLEYGTL